jgi:hypothetical protein
MIHTMRCAKIAVVVQKKCTSKPSAEAAARGRNTPHSALVFGPVGGVHNAINGLVDLVEDQDGRLIHGRHRDLAASGLSF